ncbi:MAG: hypothetical protein ACC645_10130 [Pirellulales bacterium]
MLLINRLPGPKTTQAVTNAGPMDLHQGDRWAGVSSLVLFIAPDYKPSNTYDKSSNSAGRVDWATTKSRKLGRTIENPLADRQPRKTNTSHKKKGITLAECSSVHSSPLSPESLPLEIVAFEIGMPAIIWGEG